LILASLLFNSAPSDHQMLLLQESVKEYNYQNRTLRFEDAFDEIELLGFPISFTTFELLQTKYRGDVAKDLDLHHKNKYVCWVSYFEKQVLSPEEQLSEGTYFDTTHFLIICCNTLFKVAAAIYY
jgi:DNA polymerase-3 subunit alpha/error-prone DNA polymerase